MSLAVRDATVRINGRTILDEVSLDIEPGELLAVVGPNGAGKSTLLSLLSGDNTPDTGEVLLDGRPLSDFRVLDLARRRAVQLQEQRLSFGFRVVEVVQMGRRPWAGTPAEDQDEEIVGTAIVRMDLERFVDRRFPTLSGGEKARTGFARVAAQHTPVVLLDEPTAALDIKYQERVLTEAKRFAADGHAVVAVLHDLSLAAAHADRICIVSHGRIVALGAPREVLTPDRLSEVYDHEVDVIDHRGVLIIVPQRGDQPAAHHSSALEEPSCAN